MSFNKKLYHCFLHNQRGVTLVEILAAIVIFTLIVLPLSSVYIKGVSQYQKTQLQTSLRNETDFVLSDIMRKVMGETPADGSFENTLYFELADPKLEGEANEENTKEKLIEIFSHDRIGEDIRKDFDGESPEKFKEAIAVYTRSIQYEPPQNSPELGETVSNLSRRIYQFYEISSPYADDSSPYRQFALTHSNYLTYGLFQVTPDNQKLIVYLLTVLKGEEEVRDGKEQVRFSNLTTIKDELDRLQAEEPSLIPGYIHVVRTEFSINNLLKG